MKALLIISIFYLVSCAQTQSTTEYHEKITKRKIDTSLQTHDYKLIQTSEVQYPRRAQIRGIEGYVDVQLTIGSDGVPKDITPIASDNIELFAQAAINSVAEYKYIPRKVEGVEVDVPRVIYRIRFCLNDMPTSEKQFASKMCQQHP